MYDQCYIQSLGNVQGVSPSENMRKRPKWGLDVGVLAIGSYSPGNSIESLGHYHRVFCFVSLFNRHHFLGPPPQFHF